MRKVEKFLAKYPFFVILILSIPAVWSLFVPGFYGASDDIHIAWLHQMDATLRAGKFPPRFVPDLSFGFGYPLFNFVFPLPFYIGEIFHLLGLSLVDSVKTVFILSVPLSGYFMYRLLREFTTPILGLAGATLYIFTPYRATDIFVRGAIGEIVTFVFLPLIVLSIIKLEKNEKGNLLWAGVLGLSIAGIITSHNITAYMFLSFLFIFVVLLIIRNVTPRFLFILRTFSGLILGLLISIYFWLPAIVDSRLMKYDTVFSYFDHFPTLKQLVTPFFGYGASVPGPYDGMSFFVGTINLILIIVGIISIVFFRKKISRERILFLLWGTLMIMSGIFMMNHRSAFVWDSIPFIGYFQFPWRFLTLTTFASPLFVVLFTKLKYANYLAIAIILSAILLNFSYFKPNEFLGRFDEYYLNRYIPEPIASEEYLETSEEYLRLPVGTIRRPNRNFPRITSENGQIANVTLVNGLDSKFDIEAENETQLTYNKYLFPGWQVLVDGQKAILQAGIPYGQVTFDVPSGYHKVEVEFKETLFRNILNIISLLSLILTLKITLALGKII